MNEETRTEVRRWLIKGQHDLGSALYDQLNQNVYHPVKQLIGSWTAERLKNALRVREFMECLFWQKGYPEMRPDTRAALRECFAEDIQNLATLAGCDLSHWK